MRHLLTFAFLAVPLLAPDPDADAGGGGLLPDLEPPAPTPAPEPQLEDATEHNRREAARRAALPPHVLTAADVASTGRPASSLDRHVATDARDYGRAAASRLAAGAGRAHDEEAAALADWIDRAGVL